MSGAAGERPRRRRVRTAAAPGTDPNPAAEVPEERRTDSNDARLRADRPPHWG